jgi:hypothetical protein
MTKKHNGQCGLETICPWTHYQQDIVKYVPNVF